MIYFTSDLHLGHRGIISMQNRPFENIQEMNQVLIRNYNAVVHKNDTVYILGDISHHLPMDRANSTDFLYGRMCKIRLECPSVRASDQYDVLSTYFGESGQSTCGKRDTNYGTKTGIEITTEEANRIGCELAERFAKGNSLKVQRQLGKVIDTKKGDFAPNTFAKIIFRIFAGMICEAHFVPYC